MTCYASVGCNDIGYELEFTTNLTNSDYKVIKNIPDRSMCLQNFNEMSNYTKSIIIPKVTVNGTMVQCDIKFGPELKTESPKYYIYFAEESFIRFDAKKSIVIDYEGVTEVSSFLKLDIFFEASGKFDLDWYFKGERIRLVEDTEDKPSMKFISKCIHTGIFSYQCFLFINPYTNKDIGMYSAIVKLKSDPTVDIELKAHAILPSKFQKIF